MYSRIPSMRLRPATNCLHFERSPLNRYCLGECFCFWQLGADANGIIAWGSPGPEDARMMVRTFEVTLHPPVEQHVSLVDIRDLARVDAVGFEIIHDYMVSRRDAFGPIVKRQAVLCRPGAFGAAIVGLYHLMAPHYEFQVFHELKDALAYLDAARGDELGAELGELREQIAGAPPLLLQLRSALEAAPTIPNVAELARTLNLSPRTLQRRLSEHNTSYHSELRRFRVARAEHLLTTSTLSMGEIAVRLGFATASSFVAAFRAATGVTPEAWRRERRSSGS